MTNDAPRIGRYVPWLTAYAVTAGTLYLWGYWSKFNVNILEYIGFLDLATAAAFPLVSAMIGIVGGVILGQLFSSKGMPPGGGRESSIGRVLNRHARLLLVAYLAVVLVVFPLLGTPDARAFVVPLALAPLVSFAISQRNFLSDVIADASTRTTVIVILTIILCSAFGKGRDHAANIAAGRDYLAIEGESLPGVPAKLLRLTGDFKYLGHAGDYMFALAPDSSLLILRAESVPSLVLAHRTTMRPWPPWRKRPDSS